jgi:hypothetical protein
MSYPPLERVSSVLQLTFSSRLPGSLLPSGNRLDLLANGRGVAWGVGRARVRILSSTAVARTIEGCLLVGRSGLTPLRHPLSPYQPDGRNVTRTLPTGAAIDAGLGTSSAAWRRFDLRVAAQPSGTLSPTRSKLRHPSSSEGSKPPSKI